MKDYFLTILRDEQSKAEQFRKAADSLAQLLAAEAAQKVPLSPVQVKTPLGILTSGNKLTHRVVLIPILRAGLALLPAFQKLFPSAPIGFFGIRRDEETTLPHLYYQNLPQLFPNDWIFLLDPMLATAGSACLALQKIHESHGHESQTTLVSVLAVEEGVKKLHTQFPQTTLITAGIDPTLNGKKYIVPGIGDFGDRYFGTI